MPNEGSLACKLQILLDEKSGWRYTAANGVMLTAHLYTEPPGSVGPGIADVHL
jgi:hypothetical protein